MIERVAMWGTADQVTGDRAPVAWRGLLCVAAVLAAVLVVTSGRYGYHRDELYFILIGGHPAWGYVDQPPLAPLLAHAMDALTGRSLVGLRLPAALASAATVVVTGLLARELGAGRRAQVLAGLAWSVSAITLAGGHLMTTTGLDLLCWAVLSLTVARALRTGAAAWLWVGLVAGVGLQVKVLMALLLAALLVGILVGGPRHALGTRWPWLAALLALLLWSPYLLWQSRHGWPQLAMSRAIASGSSGTSEPRALFLPYQVVLLAPVLVPVWVAGWWRLLRRRELATWRCFPVAYAVLALVLLLTGGKPYYVCGLYPVLLAAGAEPALGWLRTPARRAVAAGVLALCALVNATLFLPLVPVDRLHATPVVAVNYDAGEQVGWPELAATVGSVVAGLPAEDRAHAVVLTANYGQAGALARFAPGLPVVSGHNSLHDLAGPRADQDVVVAVGLSDPDLHRWFAQCRLAARIPDVHEVANDEAAEPVRVCRGLRAPWGRLWPGLAHRG